MDIKTLLPKEYATEITSDEVGWHSFTMASVAIELNEEDKIDEVSALPTPWARMQFVDIAFKKWQGKTANEDILTLEEKRIINYTLDLLELIFLQNFYAIDIEFIEIPNFSNDNYFDRATKTFFEFPRPTLIKIRDQNGNWNLLGSTSPYTLVYPAYHFISQSFSLGDSRRLFDRTSESIILFEKRPKIFLSFLQWIGENLSGDENHSTQFFRTALSSLDYHQHDIQSLAQDSLENSQVKAKFSENANFCIRMLSSSYAFESSYFFTNERIIIGDHHREGNKYLKDFPLKVATGYEDIKHLSRDVLPNTILKIRWLHESDFFTPKLLLMPYDLDADSFYIGDVNKTKNQRFAPPLSDFYFENLHHWDENFVPKYETSLRIYDDNYKTRAEVDILLKDGQSKIRVSRIYDSSEMNDAISNATFALKVFPNFFIPNYNEHKNSIGELPYFVSTCDESGNRTLPIKTTTTFFNAKNLLVASQVLDFNDRKSKDYSKYLHAVVNHKLNEKPDRIKISIEVGASKEKYDLNFLPKFESKRYNKTKDAGIRIGFDFGTTNSAIAYTYLGANNDIEVANFSDLGESTSYYPGTRIGFENKLAAEKETYEQVFSKYSVEPKAYAETFRSVINYANGVQSFTDWVNFNVYLHHEIPNPDETLNEIRTEFKWDINNIRFANQTNEWVSHFISSNLLLLKYLILQDGKNVNLDDIQLVWFYPLAFEDHQIDSIRKIWDGQSVFPKLAEYHEMDESIAPFINSNFYSETNTTKVLNIDIGGGTTDVCMLKGIVPRLKLSLPLAGRNVLGDLYGNVRDSLTHNAIVWSEVKPKVEITAKKKSSHEYFISQPEEIKKKILINASPIVFFFVYSVLKYVKLAIDENSDKNDAVDNYPDAIRFSGNGSKMIESILVNEKGVNHLVSLAEGKHSLNLLIEKIFGKNIRLEFSTSLKEDTVKGGVKYLINPVIAESEKQTSLDYEIVGENIDGVDYNSKIKRIQSIVKGIEIDRTKNSFLMNSFLKDFLDLLVEDEASLFESLFVMDGDNKKRKLIKCIENIRQNEYYTKLQNYISGGINNSGVSVSKLKSSLLMFELQGIINEMTRGI